LSASFSVGGGLIPLIEQFDYSSRCFVQGMLEYVSLALPLSGIQVGVGKFTEQTLRVLLAKPWLDDRGHFRHLQCRPV
jgi:hypothetical protein